MRLSEDGSAEREQWCLDNWDAVAAEVGAAQDVSLGVASHQLMLAMALRERLPRVAEVFAAGRIGVQLVKKIVYRTALVTDAEARAKVDAELAAAVTGWGWLSAVKIEQAIDYRVDRYDPYALRRAESRARSRRVDWIWSDGSGASTIEAVLFDHDAATLDKRLDAMAKAVCDADGRTVDQRRADALGALAAGADRLACTCGADDCAAASEQPSAVLVYVVAEEKSLSDDTAVTLEGGVAATGWAGAHKPGGDVRRTDHARAPVGGQNRRRRHCANGDPPGRCSARGAVCADTGFGGVRPLPRLDLPLPRLQRTRRCVRPRPHHRLSGRADVRDEPEMPMPNTPLGEGHLASRRCPSLTRPARTAKAPQRHSRPPAPPPGFTSTRTNLRASTSCASAQLVGIARETEEVTGAAVGARHPRWLYIASDRADRPGLAIVERWWWGINDHTPLTAQG